MQAFEVDHFPVKPAYGFRLEKDGRSIVISGDTNPCQGLLNGAKGADILVCDSMNQPMMKVLENQLRSAGNNIQAALLEDAHSYHAPIEAMAETAQQAGVKHLVISHMLPPVPAEQESQFIIGSGQVSSAGKITVGRDLMRLALGLAASRLRASSSSTNGFVCFSIPIRVSRIWPGSTNGVVR